MADLTKNPQWVKDCLKWRGHVLTGEKSHWCYDWDGLPVDETCPEFKEGMCSCFYEPDKENECNNG